MKPSDEVINAEKETTFVPLDEVKMKAADRKRIETKLRQLAEANTAKKEAEGIITSIKDELTPWLVSLEARKVSFDGKRYRVGDGVSVSISKDLLLRNGVTADVIAASTTRKTYTTIYITDEKAEG